MEGPAWLRDRAPQLVRVLILLLSLSRRAATATAGPMRGWMTWERFTCETECAKFPATCISESLIKSTADAMVAEGLVDAGSVE